MSVDPKSSKNLSVFLFEIKPSLRLLPEAWSISSHLINPKPLFQKNPKAAQHGGDTEDQISQGALLCLFFLRKEVRAKSNLPFAIDEGILQLPGKIQADTTGDGSTFSYQSHLSLLSLSVMQDFSIDSFISNHRIFPSRKIWLRTFWWIDNISNSL